LGGGNIGVGYGAVEVQLDALADAHVGDFGMSVAVQGVVHGLAGWVEQVCLRHYFDDDFWHG
jgi:hypothetical protein